MRISGHRLSFIITTLLLCLWIFAGCASGTTDSALTDSRASAPGEEAPASTDSQATASDEEVPAFTDSQASAPGEEAPASTDPRTDGHDDSWAAMKPTGRMLLDYAVEFTVDYYDDLALITIGDTDRYLLIPENAKAPADLDADIIPIRKPDTIYLAASAGMDYFRVLKALDTVRMTSTQAVNWSLPEVVQALDSETMLYAGKYSAPDYELLLREGIDLAIESTMIYHTPETKEKIEMLGIPVLVDKSSYEPHPLGRMEWIKLYGLLLGKTDEADAFYNEQLASLAAVPELSKMLSSTVPAAREDSTSDFVRNPEDSTYGTIQNPVDSKFDTPRNPETSTSGSAQNPVASQDSPTVAYFYITSSGYANVRSPGDYISKMIEMAGGSYAFADTTVPEDSAKATMNMQMEAFLDRALLSDILIYSTSIDGEMNSAEDLYNKAPMLKQSRAASNGNIWITGKNMYQQSTAVAQMMLELHAVISGNADEDELIFLHKLK